MSYIGDFRLGDTFDTKFTTRQISGAPFTLAGVPVISAYPGNSTTELTAGITLSVDFDSRTGLNNVRVVATSGNGYATATNYQLVITTGTVNSVSVVGEVVAEFSIENRSALMPTTAARTLVVDAAGLADANVVKVGPTGSGTAQTAGDLKATLGTPAGASLAADLAEIEGETDGIAAISTATPLTAAQIATGVWQDTTAGDFTVAASIGKSVMNGVALGTGLTINAYTGNTAQTGDAFARLGAPVGASISADIAEVEGETDALIAGVNVTSLNGDSTSAANIAKTTRAIGRGTASGVPTTTSIPTSACTPAGAAADQFKGRIITFDADTTTTALRGQATDITASSNSATPTMTVTALTTAPVSGDTFSIT